jgi:hypothetical protein
MLACLPWHALRLAPHQSDVLTVIGSQVLVEPTQPRSDVAPHFRDHPLRKRAEPTSKFVGSVRAIEV